MTPRPLGMLGIGTSDGAIVPILDFRGKSWNQTVFTTVKDGQSKALFDFYYKGEESASWMYLDSLPLENIPAARAGEPELMIRAHADSGGSLSLHIHGTGGAAPLSFKLPASSLRRLHEAEPEHGPGAAVTRHGETRPPAVRSAAPAPARERERRGGGLWLALSPLIVLLVASVFVLDLKPGFFQSRRKDATEKSATGGPPAVVAGEAPRRPYGEPRRTPAGRLSEAPVLPRMSSAEAAPGATGDPRSRSTISAGGGSVVDDQDSPRPEARREEISLGVANQEGLYRIMWGDTLWRITERFYGDREIYRSLADANRIVDPDTIIAGDTLVLPPVLGQKPRTDSEEQRAESAR